jgi:ribosomal protein S18 acetylase RimI-like enzyme
MRIRRAGPLDLAPVRSLAASAFAAQGDYGATVAHWFRARGTRAAVAEEGGAVVGFVLWTGEGRIVAIASARRRGGVGRALLRHALGDIAGPASLEVACDNVAARALFVSEGFVPAPGGEGAYPSGARYESMVRT